MRPAPGDYPFNHAHYVDLVPGDDVLAALEDQSAETQRLLATLDDARAMYRYAPGKWSVKEVLGHIADSERILAYRALALARGETQPLPGFDENAYVEHASFDAWRVADLGEQYALIRRANLVLFRNFADEAWERRGLADGKPVTVRGLVWSIAGHELHHVAILRERYNL